MILRCPNCKHKPLLQASQSTYSYGCGERPDRVLSEYRCPDCETIIRTEIPIIFYKEGKHKQ